MFDELCYWVDTYSNKWKVTFTPGDDEQYWITFTLRTWSTNGPTLERKVRKKVEAANPYIELTVPRGRIWSVDLNWIAEPVRKKKK